VGNRRFEEDRAALHHGLLGKKLLLTSLVADFCRAQTTKATGTRSVLYCKHVKGEGCCVLHHKAIKYKPKKINAGCAYHWILKGGLKPGLSRAGRS